MSPWTILGIARTNDVSEIRRAYARALKAVDVDEDPAAFMALREALESALFDADWSSRAQPDDAADHDQSAEAWTIDQDVFEPLPAWRPIEDAGNQSDACLAELDRLLFGDEGEPAADPEALIAATRAILDHPEMEQVDRAALLEDWLATILFDSIPQSDPVLPLVIDHFGWERHEGQIDQSWLVDELIRRRRTYRALDALAQPDHKLHEAFLDLTSEAPDLGWMSFRRMRKVDRLLRAIRTEVPGLEQFLSPYRVELWEQRFDMSKKWPLLLGLLGYVVFATAEFYLPGEDTSSNYEAAASSPIAPYRVFTDPALDLDPLIADASGGRLQLADLQERNPALHGELMQRWSAAQANPRGSGALFTYDVAGILDRTAREGLRGGDHALLLAIWRLRLDELQWLRREDVAACGGPALGAGAPDPRTGFGDRHREIMQRAFTEAVSGAPPPLRDGERHSFSIPPAIVAEASRRSELSADTLGRAWTGRGTPDQTCDARIALIEAALALPRSQTARLLRDMSRVL